jgi:D,D-heptose 1,7-bisphosphate phosphatase
VRPAVFLDRDNTLIHNDSDLGDPEQVRLIDGVAHGLRALREAGFHLVVVTNQAGVGRGKFSEDDVDAVHQRIAALVDEQAKTSGLIDRFYYCPYHPEATVAEYCRDHPWRKPNPGMLLQAARDMGLDLAHSWMIGDQERDMHAGQSAGCQTVLVSRDADLARRMHPTAVARDFQQAVQIVLHDSAHNQQPRVAAATTPIVQATAVAPSTAASADASSMTQRDIGQLRRAIADLTEEMRSDRARRVEFTMLKMVAGLCQLLALLLALLGLLQLSNLDAFVKWMIGAALAQMLTMTLLIVDLRG